MFVIFFTPSPAFPACPPTQHMSSSALLPLSLSTVHNPCLIYEFYVSFFLLLTEREVGGTHAFFVPSQTEVKPFVLLFSSVVYLYP